MSDTRTWRYRFNAEHPDNCEGRIFDSPDNVPKGEGWVDSPAKIGGHPAEVAHAHPLKGKPFTKKAKDDGEA